MKTRLFYLMVASTAFIATIFVVLKAIMMLLSLFYPPLQTASVSWNG